MAKCITYRRALAIGSCRSEAAYIKINELIQIAQVIVGQRIGQVSLVLSWPLARLRAWCFRSAVKMDLAAEIQFWSPWDHESFEGPAAIIGRFSEIWASNLRTRR